MSKNPDIEKNKKIEETNQGVWPSLLSARLGYILFNIYIYIYIYNLPITPLSHITKLRGGIFERF